MGNEAENMDSSNSQGTPGGDSGASTAASTGARVNANLRGLVSVAKSIVMNPKSFWAEEKLRPVSVSELYSRFVIPLAALNAVASFLFIGRIFRFSGFFSLIISTIIGFATYLVLPFIYGIIVEKLAPSFKASATSVNAMRALVYSMVPSALCMAAAFLLSTIIPTLIAPLMLITAVAAIYGLVQLWNGFSELLSVPEDRKAGLFFSTIAIMIVASIVVGRIADAISPGPSIFGVY